MKHKNRPKGSVIAAIDIGSAKIACIIAQVVDDEGGGGNDWFLPFGISRC